MRMRGRPQHGQLLDEQRVQASKPRRRSIYLPGMTPCIRPCIRQWRPAPARQAAPALERSERLKKPKAD